MPYIKTLIRDFGTTFLRVAVIFALLITFCDSLTRVYYSYMPISTWITFKSVTVENRGGEAFAVIERKVRGPQIATNHRSLIIRYPESERACTTSTLTVLDNMSDPVIIVPLKRLLSENCPDVIDGRRIEGTLQVSYIFDFPFGVKRSAVRYSNEFGLQYTNGTYVSSPPLARPPQHP